MNEADLHCVVCAGPLIPTSEFGLSGCWPPWVCPVCGLLYQNWNLRRDSNE